MPERKVVPEGGSVTLVMPDEGDAEKRQCHSGDAGKHQKES